MTVLFHVRNRLRVLRFSSRFFQCTFPISGAHGLVHPAARGAGGARATCTRRTRRGAPLAGERWANGQHGPVALAAKSWAVGCSSCTPHFRFGDPWPSTRQLALQIRQPFCCCSPSHALLNWHIIEEGLFGGLGGRSEVHCLGRRRPSMQRLEHVHPRGCGHALQPHRQAPLRAPLPAPQQAKAPITMQIPGHAELDDKALSAECGVSWTRTLGFRGVWESRSRGFGCSAGEHFGESLSSGHGFGRTGLYIRARVAAALAPIRARSAQFRRRPWTTLAPHFGPLLGAPPDRHSPDAQYPKQLVFSSHSLNSTSRPRFQTKPPPVPARGGRTAVERFGLELGLWTRPGPASGRIAQTRANIVVEAVFLPRLGVGHRLLGFVPPVARGRNVECFLGRMLGVGWTDFGVGLANLGAVSTSGGLGSTRLDRCRPT